MRVVWPPLSRNRASLARRKTSLVGCLPFGSATGRGQAVSGMSIWGKRTFFMQVAVFIHNTSQPLGLQLGEMLQARLHCPEPKLIAFDRVEEFLARTRVSLLVVVLSPFPDRALDLLRKIRAQVSGPVLAVGLAS